MTWTKQHIEKLKAEGKIKDFTWPEKSSMIKQIRKFYGKIVAKPFKQKNKAKEWIEWQLWVWCCERKVKLISEFHFSDERLFRSDWAVDPDYYEGDTLIPGTLKILIEYDGLFSEKSGHTTAKGFTKDTEKHMLSQSLGYRTLRFTALSYTTLITELNKLTH